MATSVLHWVGVATVALLLVACAQDPPPGGDVSPGPGTPPPAPDDGEVVITEADSGARFRVPLEARPLLRLDSAYVWEEPRTEGDSIEPIRVDYFQDPGFLEWELRPVEVGTTVITTSGARDCPPASPCPEDVLDFRVTITVVE